MSIELRGEETWPDRYIWQEMAVKRGIRLPLWRMQITTGYMRRWLRKLGIEVQEYLDANNEKNLRVFGQNNPDWPLRAFVGLLLEWLEWKDIGPVNIERPKRKRGRPNKVKENEV